MLHLTQLALYNCLYNLQLREIIASQHYKTDITDCIIKLSCIFIKLVYCRRLYIRVMCIMISAKNVIMKIV